MYFSYNYVKYVKVCKKYVKYILKAECAARYCLVSVLLNVVLKRYFKD